MPCRTVRDILSTTDGVHIGKGNRRFGISLEYKSKAKIKQERYELRIVDVVWFVSDLA